jgi:hypothetical protein
MRRPVILPRMGNMRNGYKILVGKPEDKIIFERPGRGEEDDIKMGL